jgi:hypothetical protein
MLCQVCKISLTLCRILGIVITPYFAGTVLVDLARCLALMPNLHTAQILHDDRYIRYPRRRGFEDVLKPSGPAKCAVDTRICAIASSEVDIYLGWEEDRANDSGG